MTPIYHPRANPVERRNQELKKGLRALLVDTKHSSWNTKIAPILFAIRKRRNEQTGYPISVLVLGREWKKPGDWVLSPTTTTPIDDINGSRLDRETVVLGTEKLTGGVPSTKSSEGDVVFYKAHHLSKASKGFHAEFAPK
jgi:hypothetical protein